MVPLLHDLLGHLLTHERCRRVLLLGVSKDAELIEPLCLNKIAQRLIMRVRLPGKSNDKRRANRHARDALTQFLDEPLDARARIGAVHRAQHRVMRVLEREINVFDDLRLRGKDLDEFVAEIFRIAVEHTDPRYFFNLGELPQETCKHRFAVEIEPIVRAVLRDENELAYTALRQLPRLGYDVLHRAAAEPAADERDRTERAAVIAALRDFHIGGIVRRRPQARCICVVDGIVLARNHKAASLQRLLDNLHDAAPRPRSDDGVRLRDLVEELLTVSLTETSRHDETAAASRLLIIRHPEHGRNGFFLRRLNECAGIDDQDIRLCWFCREFDAVLPHDAEHNLRIH